jgi:hypothetical protein
MYTHKVNIPYYNVYTSFWDILYLHYGTYRYVDLTKRISYYERILCCPLPE